MPIREYGDQLSVLRKAMESRVGSVALMPGELAGREQRCPLLRCLRPGVDHFDSAFPVGFRFAGSFAFERCSITVDLRQPVTAAFAIPP